jgi:hypothetical protein
MCCNATMSSAIKKYHEVFNEIKCVVVTTHVLALPNIRQKFKIEVDALRHVVGLVSKQQKRLVANHSETF